MLHRFVLPLALLGSIVSSLSAQRPSALVAIGDSLTDSGRLFALTGFPAAPYWQGRFSNGPVWIEQLAADLQLSGMNFTNLAIGGSTTEQILTQQVLPFVAANLGAVPPGATYVIWGGANDLLELFTTPADPAVVIGNAVTNLTNATLALAAAGGQHFLWVNMPDIGLIPRTLASGDPATIAGATALAGAFNQGLEFASSALASAGIQVDIVDAFGLTQELVAHPHVYGLHNVTEPALRLNGTVAHDIKGRLWFDDIHPTKAGHEQIMIAALRRMAVPRRGDMNNDYQVNGQDVALLFQAFGSAPLGSPADLDNDLDVDFDDFLILQSLIHS